MPRESKLFRRSVQLDPSRDLHLTLVEDPTLDLSGDDTWCSWCLWPAAKVLIGYLSTFDDAQLKAQSVLELGSGCGAVGMYLAQRGASPVMLTDLYKALPLLKRNVAANGLPCQVLPLPWGTPVDRLCSAIKEQAPFDWVVASDCSYEFVTPERPSPTLDALLQSLRLGARALVSVSRRPNEVEAFNAAVKRAGLAPTVVHSGQLTDKSEGVSECIVYMFDFRDEAPDPSDLRRRFFGVHKNDFEQALKSIHDGRLLGEWSAYFFPDGDDLVNGINGTEAGAIRDGLPVPQCDPLDNASCDDAVRAYLAFEADGISFRRNYIAVVEAVAQELEQGAAVRTLLKEQDERRVRRSLRQFECVARHGNDEEVISVCRRALAALDEG